MAVKGRRGFGGVGKERGLTEEPLHLSLRGGRFCCGKDEEKRDTSGEKEDGGVRGGRRSEFGIEHEGEEEEITNKKNGVAIQKR